MDTDVLYAIALRSCNNIGDSNFKKITDHFGTAEQAWKSHKSEFKTILGIGQKNSADIGNSSHLDLAEQEIEFCIKNKINILTRNSTDYPKLLNQCDDAPAILYIKGNYNQELQSISMFGTRNMTTYGKHFIEEFLEALQSKNAITISGLAYGTDACVHEKSIENNIPTIAILAHGLHMLYPAKHRLLADKILENNGAIISEFNSTQKPDRKHFIQRNRVIAGLSQHSILVESAYGGGSISTVNFANDYSRDVFALPGKITDKYSQGCNRVIAQNKAECIVTVNDLVNQIIIEPHQQLQLFDIEKEQPKLSEEQSEIYNLIRDNNSISFDDLVILLNKPTHLVLSLLLNLELNSHIKSTSARQYQIIG